MIGTNLAKCILDILQGRVAIEDVEQIISSSRRERWSEVMKGYREMYWWAAPQEAEAICERLLSEGKVTFPRNRSAKVPVAYDTWWFTSESQITYQ